jgi:membrane dipeptidase
MHRREFARTLGATLGSLVLQSRTLDAQPAIPSRVHDLYNRSIVIDALASAQSFNVPWPPPYQPLSEEQLRNARESGITAINLTVNGETFENTMDNIAFWLGEVERRPDVLCVIRKEEDLQAAKQLKRLGLMFGFQGTDVLGADLGRLLAFRRLGVRIIQLTYNTRSLAGDGCLEPGNAGLSTFGKQLVARMDELGIAVDLGHCGMQTCLEAIAASHKPVIISHTGCRAVHDHPRNKTDEVLRALAARQGVVGIYLMPYLGSGDGNGPPTKDLVIRHIDHAVHVCGIDHVGIGSDQSITPIQETPEYRRAVEATTRSRKAAGIGAPEEDRPPYTPELNSPRRLEWIAAELSSRGYPDDGIERIIGGNFQRILQKIWAA